MQSFPGARLHLTLQKKRVKVWGIKSRKHNLDIGTIITEVAKYFSIDESLLRLKSKQQEIVQARHTNVSSKELPRHHCKQSGLISRKKP
jgi:chromosomal replication initiation ATPase DnaA